MKVSDNVKTFVIFIKTLETFKKIKLQPIFASFIGVRLKYFYVQYEYVVTTQLVRHL